MLIPNRNWGGEGLLGCVFGYVNFATLGNVTFKPLLTDLVSCTGSHLNHLIRFPDRCLWNFKKSLKSQSYSFPRMQSLMHHNHTLGRSIGTPRMYHSTTTRKYLTLPGPSHPLSCLKKFDFSIPLVDHFVFSLVVLTPIRKC